MCINVAIVLMTERRRGSETERKREFGVCVVGPVSRISAVLARDKTTCT